MMPAPMRRSDGGDVLYGRRCSAPASKVGVVLYVEGRMKVVEIWGPSMYRESERK